MSYSTSLPAIDTFTAWRDQARIALSHDIAPEEICWSGESGGLFAGSPLPKTAGEREFRVPALFFDLAKSAIWHSEHERFSLLYKALWRIAKQDGHPLSPVDPLGAKLQRLAKNVRRDMHKMHAFVRFQELQSDSPRRRFIAWFEPEHFITEPASSFFAKRFADMDWMIATPSICASFDGAGVKLTEFDGKPPLPGDDIESLWGTYFSNIFNPARIKLNAMRSEMPVKYWKNMPETALIPDMLAKAQERVQAMRDAMPSQAPLGAERISSRYRAQMPSPMEAPSSLAELEIALQKCQRCQLCEMATQAVPGSGPKAADLMVVGEQPGDREDLEGRPFVGPAGEVLNQAMVKVGIKRDETYLTNAVKHFKFKVSGKRRIHESPNRSEIDHCRWWLDQERSLVKPKVILSLGASAAYGLTGVVAKQSDRRGHIEQLDASTRVIYSWHPSYILRLSDTDKRQLALAQLESDLIRAKDALG